MTTRRPFATFLILVFINLFLLSIQVRNDRGQLLLRSWSMAAFSPVAAGVHYLFGGTRNFIERYFALLGAEEENRRLREEVADLKLELQRLRGLSEWSQKRNRFELLIDQFTFETVVAGVIWKSAPFHADRIVLNAGKRHGVHPDSAVLTPEGVVGRVVTSSARSAEVELLTNPNAAAGAVLEESRLQGVVQGTGGELLSLNFIPTSELVQAGQTLFTSGNDRIYPKGLPIGSIAVVKEGTLYHDILVDPFADFRRLEEVMIVVSR